MLDTLSAPSARAICKALQTDASNTHLAREFGVHKETIVAWRKKFGIPRFVPREQCRQVILTALKGDRRGQGVYLSELVNSCQCSRQKLYWILKDLEREGLIYAEGSTNARRWYLNL